MCWWVFCFVSLTQLNKKSSRRPSSGHSLLGVQPTSSVFGSGLSRGRTEGPCAQLRRRVGGRQFRSLGCVWCQIRCIFIELNKEHGAAANDAVSELKEDTIVMAGGCQKTWGDIPWKNRKVTLTSFCPNTHQGEDKAHYDQEKEKEKMQVNCLQVTNKLYLIIKELLVPVLSDWRDLRNRGEHTLGCGAKPGKVTCFSVIWKAWLKYIK